VGRRPELTLACVARYRFFVDSHENIPCFQLPKSFAKHGNFCGLPLDSGCSEEYIPVFFPVSRESGSHLTAPTATQSTSIIP
jgi:hypothetical protein